jgi:hypothetical protein
MERARNLVSAMRWEGLPEPAVVATPDRGIEFEWRRADRMLAIEVLYDGSIEFLTVENAEPVEEGVLSAIDGRLVTLSRWLTKS